MGYDGSENPIEVLVIPTGIHPPINIVAKLMDGKASSRFKELEIFYG